MNKESAMKIIVYGFGLALFVAGAGCSTSRPAPEMHGQGLRQTYNAPFNATWKATVDAAHQDNLRIISADPQSGHISTHRAIPHTSSGENVGIWVTPISASQTAVEVVSRQAGPPTTSFKNWQMDILQTVSANLTPKVPTAVGSAPGGTSATSGGATSTWAPALTEPSTTTQTISPNPPATTADQATTSERIAQEQQHLEQLRKDITAQREKVSNEIQRLQGELQQLQNRLSDLEKQQSQLK